jgi:hypothetical protein
MDTGRWHRRNFNTPKRWDITIIAADAGEFSLPTWCLFRMWMFKRDHRLTGNVYVVNGLETIKDD